MLTESAKVGKMCRCGRCELGGSDTVRPMPEPTAAIREFAEGWYPNDTTSDNQTRPAGHPTSFTVDGLKPLHPVERVTA